MQKSLPQKPSLHHLRKQAKDLLDAFRSGQPDALARFAESLPALKGKSPDRVLAMPLALHDAQSVIAREYGFDSWKALSRHVMSVRAKSGTNADIGEEFVKLAISGSPAAIGRIVGLYRDLPTFDPVCALVSGEVGRVRAWIADDPMRVTHRIGHTEWLPLEYVCYSKVHRVFEGRADGLLECARLLLDEGADPNTFHTGEGDSKLTVLYGACGESRHTGIVRLLLERGANPNDGESVPHSAQHNLRDILEALLEHGADISSRGEQHGNTSLYFLLGHRESDPNCATATAGVEWLLDHGADPNVTSSDKEETPLQLACRNGRSALVVDMMLDHSAYPTLRRKDGRSALDLALITGNVEAAEALRQRGVTTELSAKDTFLAACASGQVSDARPELEPEDVALLCNLAELGRTDGVRAMLDAGFEASVKGKYGETPLHFASFCGWADTVRVLLEHGAPIDVRDGTYNATPFGWAMEGFVWVRNERGDYPGVFEALIGAGFPASEVEKAIAADDVPADVREQLTALLPLTDRK